MATALFIGRFQPFHNGHLAVIKDLLHQYDYLNIVIGSAQEKMTEKNPFSASEREEMIRSTLEAEHIPPKYSIYRLNDVFDDELWGERIKELCNFDIAYTNNEWTAKCLEKQGLEVKNHKFYDRSEISGTQIRELIRSGGDWENLVPFHVKDFIKKWILNHEGLFV
ncbi:MAG: nicotinamide-nucleotide adenylyltransferase [Candidatus Micrarchaeota archaeon]|nr:nicotinamide-nucleotide adenylyltransferase [Candidatus Micrarchaeota archaeon]